MALDDPRPLLAALTWAWVAVAAARVQGARRVGAAAAGAAAVGGGGAALIAGGPLEPYNHGLNLWSTVVKPGVMYGVVDAKHGAAHVWLARKAWQAGLPESWLGAVGVSVGALASLALGSAVAGLAGAEAGALAAMALFLSPLHLRVGASLSSFTVAELGACVMVLGLVRRRDGVSGAAWLAAGGAALAVCGRAEWEVLAPTGLLIGALTLGPRPQRAELAPLALLVLVAGLHAACTVAGGASSNVSNPELGALRGLPLLAMVVVLVAVILRRTSPEVSGAPAVASAVALVAAACVEVGAWPAPFDGRLPHLDDLTLTFARLHAAFHPALAAPTATGAAVVGGAIALARSPWRSALVAAWWTLAIVVYAGVATWDNLSTYMRGSLGVGWLVAGLAGVGLRAVLPRGRQGVALGAALLVLGAAPRWQVAAHRFPDADELVVLREARLARLPGQAVYAPLQADLPEPASALGVGVERGDIAMALLVSAQDSWLRPATEALRDPTGAVGGLWIASLACYRPASAHPSDADDLVGAGGRLWRGVNRRVAEMPPWPAKPPSYPLSGLPCWDQPHLAIPRADGTWECPRGTVPSGRSYEDPVCAAMRLRFELEGIAGFVVGPGELSGPHLHLFTEEPVIGVYRIVGVRPDVLGP